MTSRRFRPIGGRESEAEGREQGTEESAEGETSCPADLHKSPPRIADLIRHIFFVPPIGGKSDYRTVRGESEGATSGPVRRRLRTSICSCLWKSQMTPLPGMADFLPVPFPTPVRRGLNDRSRFTGSQLPEEITLAPMILAPSLRKGAREGCPHRTRQILAKKTRNYDLVLQCGSMTFPLLPCRQPCCEGGRNTLHKSYGNFS